MRIKLTPGPQTTISLVTEVPDKNRVKLLGYNGIGKSLTAKILATLSGNGVWASQEKINHLSNYLPHVEIKIEIDGDSYIAELSVTNWDLDPSTGLVNPKSLGQIYLNNKEVRIDEFQDEFNCYVVEGDEDIDKQITQLTHKLELTINQQLDEIGDRYSKLRRDYEDLKSKLNEGQLFSRIISRNEEIENKSQDFDKDVDDLTDLPDLLRLAGALQGLPDHNYISTEGPKATIDKIEDKLSDLDSKINENKREIKTLESELPEDEEEAIQEVSEEVESLRKQLRDISFPLDRDEFDSIDKAQKEKEKLIIELENLKKSEEILKKHDLRESFWPDVLSVLNDRIRVNDLGEDVKILLNTENRDDVNPSELRNWYQKTIQKGRERLGDDLNLSEIEQEIRSIEERKNKIEKHIKKLREYEAIEEDLGNKQAELERKTEVKEKAKNLPELRSYLEEVRDKKQKYKEAKSLLSIADDIDSWQDLEIGTPKSGEDVVDKLSEVGEARESLLYASESLNEAKAEYEKKLKQSEVPKKSEYINNLLEKGEIVKIAKLAAKLNKKNTPNSLSEIKKECNNNLQDLIKENEQGRKENEFIKEANTYLGDKIKALLNKPPFRENVFDGNLITSVNPDDNLLKYRDSDSDREREKYISDYSTGEKAFAFSLASIMNKKTTSSGKSLLFLDEFGAVLAIDKENVIMEHINDLQEKEGWPDKYVLVLPYKGEFERYDYKNKYGRERVEKWEEAIEKEGYVFHEIINN